MPRTRAAHSGAQGRALGALDRRGGKGELFSCGVKCNYRDYILAIYPKGNMCGNGCKVLKMTEILLVPWRRQGLPECEKAARSGLKAEESSPKWPKKRRREERGGERECVCVGGSRAAMGSHATYFRKYRGFRRINVYMFMFTFIQGFNP